MFEPSLPEPVLGAYTLAQVRFASAAWPMRAAEELRSSLIFRALARAAFQSGMERAWIDRFRSAIRDEVRHAKLCAFAGQQFGAEPPHYDAQPVRARLAGLADPLHRTAVLVLIEVAIGETISTQLFKAGRHVAVEPLTHAALGSILRDEVLHSRLGWGAVSALLPSLTEERRVELELELTRALGAFERQQAVPALRRLEAAVPFDPAYAELGVLPPEVRVESFYSAIEGLVVPRLNRLGIDGTRAWSRRYLASS